jgi:hypothetical protein|nr:MAG TPA: hypothetical protein [Caudoviricetes sp.]
MNKEKLIELGFQKVGSNNFRYKLHRSRALYLADEILTIIDSVSLNSVVLHNSYFDGDLTEEKLNCLLTFLHGNNYGKIY